MSDDRSWRARAVDAAFLLALAALAAVAAAPIYHAPYEIVTVAGALVLAVGIAALSTWRGWSWPYVVILTIALYLLAGVALAIPSDLGSRGAFLLGYRDLVVATVFSWKQLVTVALPVGTYQQLLVPLFTVELGATVAGLLAAWRRRQASLVAVAIMVLPLAFALLFGSSAVSAPIELGSWAVPAPRETAEGIVGVVLACGFLRWRMLHDRAIALRAASAASGVRGRGAGLFGRLRRAALALAVAVVAVAVAVPIASTALQPDERQVLRTSIDPVQQLSLQLSPLTQYRASFDSGDYDRPLVTVTGATAAVSRLRLATLGFYDGVTFGVVPDAAGGASPTSSPGSSAALGSAFARAPSIVAGGATGAAEVTVRIDDYSGLWAPTVAGLRAVSFSGPRAAALTDGFFYNGPAQAGVELAGLTSGDSYTLAAEPPSTPSLASIEKPQQPGEMIAPSLIPSSLVGWVKQQGLGGGASALQQLIERLRARGYLSHSLEQPSGPASTNWLAALGGARFASSTAGESTDRIGALFTQLLAKQSSTTSTSDKDLVAAVGDDEQFSVASALIAEYLGFPARVVLGFALNSSATDADSLPACAAGVCSGKNLTAWIEVEGAGGVWVPVNTTPQHVDPLAPVTSQLREPRNETTVNPQNASEQKPPEANPGGTNTRHTTTKPTVAVDDRWGPVVRYAGAGALVLLVLVAPFAAALAVKAARTRSRRRAASNAGRIAAGWDELVDAAVDLGMGPPPSLTRREAAAVWARAAGRGPGGTEPPRQADALANGPLMLLADTADAAVFGDIEPTDAAANQYWTLLGLERERLSRRVSRWRRLRARVSLRSFARVPGTK